MSAALFVPGRATVSCVHLFLCTSSKWSVNNVTRLCRSPHNQLRSLSQSSQLDFLVGQKSENANSVPGSRPQEMKTSQAQGLLKSPEMVIDYIVQYRAKVVTEDGDYLDLRPLWRHLRQRSPIAVLRSSAVFRTWNTLTRIAREIDACIEISLVRSMVTTAKDIEKAVLALRSFTACESFTEIGVGPLLLHPRIRQAMGPGSAVAKVVVNGEAPAEVDALYMAMARASLVPDHTDVDFIEFLSQQIANGLDTKSFSLDNYLCLYADKMGLKHPVELGIAYRSAKVTKLLIDRGRKKKERAIRVANRLIQNEYDQVLKTKRKTVEAKRLTDLEIIIGDLRALTSAGSAEDFEQARSLVKQHLHKLLHDPHSRFVATRAGLTGLMDEVLSPLLVWALNNTKPNEYKFAPNSASTASASVATTSSPPSPKAADKGKSMPDAAESEEGLLDHIRGVLLLARGAGRAQDVVEVLADAEKTVTHHKGVASFEDLGLGTFCEFCARNWDNVGDLVQTPASWEQTNTQDVDLHAGSLRGDIAVLAADMVRACHRSGQDPRAVVPDMVALVRLQLGRAGCGGFDSETAAETVQSSLSAHDAGEPASEPAVSLPSSIAAVAFPPHELGSFEPKSVHRLQSLDPVAALRQSPRMRDIGASLLWGLVFEPWHGSFESFLAGNQESLRSQGIGVFGVGGGQYWLVDLDHTVEDFKQRVSDFDGIGCAESLVSLCVQAGHASLAPTGLIAAEVESFVVAQAGERTTQLILEAITTMPIALVNVTHRVLLGPYLRSNVSGAEDLLRPGRALRYEELVALHSLGLVLGIDAWTESLRHAYMHGFPRHASGESFVVMDEGRSQMSSTNDVVGAEGTIRPAQHASEVSETESNPSDAESELKRSHVSADVLSRMHTTLEAAEKSESDEDAMEYNTRVCKDIRRRLGFDLDQSLNAEERRILEDLRAVTQRSIKRLSADLYSEDIHFVFELIQNADDNAYHDNVVPAIEILLSQSALQFKNNEVGFALSNVLALCSIDKSTKSIARRDNIGHKGIGFKSVFKITSTPEIHSGKFHFAFDSSDGGLGYIVPYPVRPPPGWAEGGGTTIMLPFNHSVAASVHKAIDDIRPSLLLFLRKLQVVTVSDESKLETKTMRRVSMSDESIASGSEVVNILTRKGADSNLHTAFDPVDDDLWSVERWTSRGWAVAQQFVLTQIAVTIKSRASETAEEVTRMKLAIPIYSEDQLARPLPLQDTFAFLPLRSYGFRVVLHADWDVPSSRESIAAFSSRNQLLRDHIPALFRECVWTFVQIASKLRQEETSNVDNSDAESETAESHHGVHLLNNLICALPLPGQLSEFFTPTAAAVTQMLKREKFLPCSDGQFSLPSECVLRVDDTELMACSEPFLHSLGLSWAAEGLKVPRPVAEALGVRSFEASLVLELLRSAATTKWQTAHCVDLDWLVRVLASLHGDRQLHKFLILYQQVAFIPLANGTLAKLADGPIFEVKDPDILLRYSFANQQRIMDPALSRHLEPSSTAHTVLARMGVRQMAAVDFFSEHVSGMLWDRTTSNADRVGLLQFTKNHLSTDGLTAFWAKVQSEGIGLLTRSGHPVNAKQETVLLGPDYDETVKPIYDLPSLPGYDGVLSGWLRNHVVSTEYTSTDDDKESWVAFLRELGVVDLIRVTPWEGKTVDAVDAQYWATEIERHVLSEGQSDATVVQALQQSATVSDFHSSELRELLRAFTSTAHQDPQFEETKQTILAALFRIIVQGWTTEFARFTWAEIDIGGRKYRSHSSFIHLMRTSRWLRSAESIWHQPDELFADSRELKRQFGVMVPYFDQDCPPTLAAALGITTELRPAVVFKLLQQWRQQEQFSTRMRYMTEIYKYIEYHLAEWRALQIVHHTSPTQEGEEGGEAKQHEIHLFVPNNHKLVSGPTVLIPGSFVPVSQCAISDPVGLFDPSQDSVFPIHKEFTIKDGQPVVRVVGSVYRQMHSSLVRLGCAETAHPSLYIDVMEDVARTQSSVNVGSMLVALRLLAWLGTPTALPRTPLRLPVEEKDGDERADDGDAEHDDALNAGGVVDTSEALRADLVLLSRVERQREQEALDRRRTQLSDLLMERTVLPSSAGTWIALKTVWFYHDREELDIMWAHRLPNAIRQHCLATEHQSPTWNLSFSQEKYRDLKRLMELLGIPPISKCVQLTGRAVGDVVEWPGGTFDEVCAASHALQAWGTRAERMGQISSNQLETVQLRLQQLLVVGADSIRLTRRVVHQEKELHREELGVTRMCLNVQDRRLLATKAQHIDKSHRSGFREVAVEMLKLAADTWHCEEADRTKLVSLMEATMAAHVGTDSPDTASFSDELQQVIGTRQARSERRERAEACMREAGFESWAGQGELWLPYPDHRCSIFELKDATQSGRVSSQPARPQHLLFQLIQEEALRVDNGTSTLAGPDFSPPTHQQHPEASPDFFTRVQGTATDEPSESASQSLDASEQSLSEQSAHASRVKQRGNTHVEVVLEQGRTEAVGSAKRPSSVVREYREGAASLGFGPEALDASMEMPEIQTVQLDDGEVGEAPPVEENGGQLLGRPHDANARKGEWIVLQYLRRLEEEAGRRVVWVNEKGEAGEPFDLVVLSPSGEVVNYVEVKTTAHAAKRTFEVTRREMEMALQMGGKFTVFRVALEDGGSQKTVSLTQMEHFSRHFGKSLQLIVSLGSSPAV